MSRKQGEQKTEQKSTVKKILFTPVISVTVDEKTFIFVQDNIKDEHTFGGRHYGTFHWTIFNFV